MRIAIVASKRNKENVNRAKRLADLLEKQGHNVDRTMIERTREEERKDFSKTFKINISSIRKADLVVAEATIYSAGLGFLTAMAINERKHVLCLHNADAKESIEGSSTLQGATSKMLTFKKYTNETIEEILKEYTNSIKQKLDTKFILIISPKINKYLKWKSEETRKHKAEIVREAIEDKMKKDTEYKNYQKEQK